jgi:acetylornithine deacetylase
MSLIADSLPRHAAEMTDLLSSVVAIPSVSGQERQLTEFVAGWARRQGWEVDLWQADEDELARIASLPPLPPKFIPLAGRPTAVVRIRGTGGGKSLMFNAHTDVVAAPGAEKWRFGPWSGVVSEGKLYGRGACDTKGPMVSALWAMKSIAESGRRLAGDLMLELIPGEEDCVGLGTLTCVARGWKSDGVVVLEPTEGMPMAASRGGLRFEVATLGRSVHGTVKWLGKDAIAGLPKVLECLNRLEGKWNEREADAMFADYPLMRPITVDMIRAGEWQGMLCDRCVCGGYLELLPGDDLKQWQERLIASVRQEMGGESDELTVRILEQYQGHSTALSDPLCVAAAKAAGITNWSGFNSGCEAGLRANLLGTPTLVWGPGSLAQAHAVDEYVELAEVEKVAGRMAEMAVAYCNDQKYN